ncbi:alpha/beta hydrolase [Novosphingobium sp. P6W]|jgi:predicted alpha/beta hydrolase family esterase|uniref:RBBP9/YdeN family alpha/beta hydrolase n=1 Tax=Novosphingobium sp. P6W TaxID=1609758 RepID=UPI00069815F3|nr:alpha/beta hydrolase [Novosphingobium sp. P6W]AXB76105.1 alpha/beta hydrolase [Novosphingobium sp. P6W]
MANFRYPNAQEHTPLILLVPGTPLAAGHWMNRWTRLSEHCRVVELGLWDEPHRNTWVNKLNLAVRRADRPVVIVTDDIAALALSWWVEFEALEQDNPVLGAVIVNPPNVDLPGADPRLGRFGACPRQPLPFTSFLVSDLEGSAVHQRSLMRLAKDWGSCPVCDDTRGDWAQGWMLIQSVLGLSPAGSVTPEWTHDENLAVREAKRQWAAI